VVRQLHELGAGGWGKESRLRDVRVLTEDDDLDLIEGAQVELAEDVLWRRIDRLRLPLLLQKLGQQNEVALLLDHARTHNTTHNTHSGEQGEEASGFARRWRDAL
jgi:hypothetical protein